MPTPRSSLPWWRTDEYVVDAGLPPQWKREWAGPNGVALVRAWPDGRTDAGWGLIAGPSGLDFGKAYDRGNFKESGILFGYDRGKHAFAFIMRSVHLVCIDIDGKNGGLDHAKRLGALPLTMAETSKSGDGYHLFYLLEDDWVDDVGYAKIGDRIGIEQGVDIRGTGCVYHHSNQRWNRRAAVPLPQHLEDLLLHRERKVAAQSASIKAVLASDDPMEILMMRDEILSALKKPIPQGKRNQTLFAIGSQLSEAGIAGWEQKLLDRAVQLGLPEAEADKIVANVQRYATPVTP